MDRYNITINVIHNDGTQTMEFANGENLTVNLIGAFIDAAYKRAGTMFGMDIALDATITLVL